MGFSQRSTIHGGNNVWSTAQRQKRSNDLMLVLSMNATTVGYYELCLLVWSGLENGIKF